jgi:branched-chain amino acid transport system permease protein
MRTLDLKSGGARLLLRAGLLTVAALGATFLLDPYRNYQLATSAGVFAAVAGLTLLVGLTGQLSLGHAVLMAAGGYGYALTATWVAGALAGAGGEMADGVVGWLLPLLAGVAGALVASGALGLLLGLAAARLRGPYLAGLTLALVIALPSAASTIPGLAGAQGISAPFVPVPDALAALIAVEQWHAWLAILVTACVVTPLVALRAGRAGLRMRAVHDDETAARLAGIDPGRVKAGAFGGAAIGAVLVTLLPWVVDQATAGLPADLGHRLQGNLEIVLFGVVVVVVTVLWPGGLARLLPAKKLPQNT